MLLFAHVGITFALFYIAAMAFPKSRPHISYWYVIAGSMLPDILDKPGMMLFDNNYGSGRVFAHSLLFVVVLGMAGYTLYARKGDSRVLLLAGGSLVHQLLDSMWETPVTFLWPLLGWQFERLEHYGSFGQYLTVIYGNLGNIGDPALLTLLMTEIVGFVIVMLFLTGWLVKRVKDKEWGLL